MSHQVFNPNDDIEFIIASENDDDTDSQSDPDFILFHTACTDGDIQTVRKYLDENDITFDFNQLYSDGGDDCNDETALYNACQNEHITVVKMLLEDDRIDVNKVDYHGQTALHSACMSNCIDIIKFLMDDSRVDINKKDNVDNTVFHFSCTGGRTDIIQLFIDDERALLTDFDNPNKSLYFEVCRHGRFPLLNYY